MNVPDRRRSLLWKIFTRHEDGQTASCTKCHKKLSSASIGNLRKHWERIHGGSNDNKADASDTSDGECGNNSDKEASKTEGDSKSKSTWQFFDILDSDQYIAKCKVCDKEVSYETMADLRTHAKEHDDNVSADEDILQKTTSKESPAKKTMFNRRSIIWRYMKVINEEELLAVCKICGVKLSYVSSISNLRKHVKRQHPTVLLQDNTNVNKLLISADGQFYEIEGSTDVEKDPFETDDFIINETINDSVADHEYEKQPKPPKKRAKLNLKSIKRENSPKVLQNTYDNNSSDENTPYQNTFKRRYTSKTNNTAMDSIDYFAQYLTSLLKQLPKHISDQLQSDIIKQVITTKIALETTSYSVDNKTVTVTINNGNSTSYSEVPVANNSDVTIPDAVEEISIDNTGPSMPAITITESIG